MADLKILGNARFSGHFSSPIFSARPCTKILKLFLHKDTNDSFIVLEGQSNPLRFKKVTAILSFSQQQKRTFSQQVLSLRNTVLELATTSIVFPDIPSFQRGVSCPERSWSSWSRDTKWRPCSHNWVWHFLLKRDHLPYSKCVHSHTRDSP